LLLPSSADPQFEPRAPLSSAVPVTSEPESLAPHATEPSALPPLPLENPAWNGWDVLLIVVLTIVTMVAVELALIFGAHYLFYPRVTIFELTQRPILALFAQFLVDAAVVLYIFLLIEGKYHTPFWQSIRWDWQKARWLMLALGAATFMVLTLLGNLLPMPKETPFDKLFERPRDAYLVAIIAVTLGPFMEELFFRGLLYPVLAKRWGAAWGIFLSALPFALLHLPQYGYSWGILLVILAIGTVCGMVRAATKSVGASFLVHAGYNGAQMLIAVVFTHGFTRMPKGLLEVCFMMN